MVAVRSHSVLAVLLSDAGDECDSAQSETAEPLPPGSGPLLPEEQDGKRDLGSLDLPDDDYTGDWREDYGDSVGISSWREL